MSEKGIDIEVVLAIGLPKGVAAVVNKDRVLWLGGAREFNPSGWPEGSKLNLGPLTYSAVRAKLQTMPGVQFTDAGTQEPSVA